MVNQRTTGVVSFLDVLGWKGIWINHEDAIASLNKFVQEFREYGTELSIKMNKNDFKIICFSDTIVVFTPSAQNNFERAVYFHAELCKWALEKSLEKYKLPLRGAIGYGEYYYDDENTTVLGPVIDEVSSWGDKVDWIGVILAPSIRFKLRFQNINFKELEKFGPIVIYLNIPYKERVNGLILCVKWGTSNGIKLLENLLTHQKYMPLEVTLKYLNTLVFLESQNKSAKKNFENSHSFTNSGRKETYTLKTGATLEFGDSFNDLISLFVQEISIDADSVVIVFNLKNSDNLELRESILKVGEFVTFESFKILVKTIFLGTQSSLVELEVEWFNK